MDEVMLERQMACVPSISELRCMFWIKLSFLMLHSLCTFCVATKSLTRVSCQLASVGKSWQELLQKLLLGEETDRLEPVTMDRALPVKAAPRQLFA